VHKVGNKIDWSTILLHSGSVNTEDLVTMTAQTLSVWKTTALDDYIMP